MTTIVFAHPWHGSFNKAILDTATKELQNNKTAYQVIDLNKDGFSPVMTENELALYARGESQDPSVNKYQSMLKVTDRLVFIFPLWWYDVPAVLKGFFDKVMLKDFAWTESGTGLKGKLTHIQSAMVITTAQSPKWYIKYFAGNTIQSTFIRATLKGIGIKNVKWLHCSDISHGASEKRKAFLKKIVSEIK